MCSEKIWISEINLIQLWNFCIASYYFVWCVLNRLFVLKKCMHEKKNSKMFLFSSELYTICILLHNKFTYRLELVFYKHNYYNYMWIRNEFKLESSNPVILLIFKCWKIKKIFSKKSSRGSFWRLVQYLGKSSDIQEHDQCQNFEKNKTNYKGLVLKKNSFPF